MARDAILTSVVRALVIWFNILFKAMHNAKDSFINPGASKTGLRKYSKKEVMQINHFIAGWEFVKWTLQYFYVIAGYDCIKTRTKLLKLLQLCLFVRSQILLDWIIRQILTCLYKIVIFVYRYKIYYKMLMESWRASNYTWVLQISRWFDDSCKNYDFFLNPKSLFIRSF